MSGWRLFLSVLGALLASNGALAQRAPPAEPQTVLLESAAKPDAPGNDAVAPSQLDATPASPKTTRKGNPLWAIPLQTLSVTRDRPLFSPSRRPPPPAVAAAPAPAPVVAPAPVIAAGPEQPPFTLVGTIIGEKEQIAIFFNQTANTTTRVRQGDAESGWTVKSVDLRAAVIEKNAQSVTLDLPKRSDQGPAGAVPSIGAMPKPVDDGSL